MTPRIVIDDPLDPRIHSFRGVRDADLRGRDGLFCVESPRILRRFLHALECSDSSAPMTPRLALHSVFTTAAIADSLEPLLERVIERSPHEVPVYCAEESLLTAISGYGMHKGAMALGIRGALASVDDLVAAMGPSDHMVIPCGVVLTDNIGAIFRNAGSLGGSGVLLAAGCSDPLHRKSIRIGAGRTFSVPWAVSGSWPTDLKRLREEFGFAVLAAEDAPGAIPLDALADCPTLARSRRVAIVLGAEGAGLSTETMDLCDAVCAIPMREPGGLVEAHDRPSLNVAVASALLLHGVRRACGHSRSPGT